MAMSIEAAWTLFRAIRVLVYTLSTVGSLGLSAIYTVLLIYGWNSYNLEQRALVSILLAIYAISTLTFYLMLIFRFRLWLDGVRLAFLLLLQVGGTVTFDLFYPFLPCTKLGSENTCKLIETIAIIGGYALAGLVIFFAFYLAAMHYVPVPAPRIHPEALLALQLSQKVANMEKRDMEKPYKRASISTIASAASVYSQRSARRAPFPSVAPPTQTSFRGPSPAPEPGSVRVPVGNYRSQTPGSHYRPITPGSMHTGEMSTTYGSQTTPRELVPPFDYNRPVTPAASMRSVALTSASSIRTVPRQRYYNNNGIPAPQPRIAPNANNTAMPNPLTQAFTDPISRQGTPMTALSNGSFYVPEVPYQRRQYGMLLSPPGLPSVGEGLNFPQPPASAYRQDMTSPGSRTNALPPLSNMSRPPYRGTAASPPPIAMQVGEALRMRTPSPSAQSMRSMYSIRSQPSRNPSVSSIPRSASPETVSFNNMPTTPRSGVLPARPDMTAAVYNGRYGTTSPDRQRQPPPTISPDSQRQRYRAVPDVIANAVPAPSNQQSYPQPSSNTYRVPPPRDDWIGREIASWRKDLPNNARVGGSRR